MYVVDQSKQCAQIYWQKIACCFKLQLLMLIFVIFCYFLLFFVIFCYFLLFFVIFCYFLLFFVIFCYFLLFFVIFCYFLSFFVIFLLFFVIFCYFSLQHFHWFRVEFLKRGPFSVKSNKSGPFLLV